MKSEPVYRGGHLCKEKHGREIAIGDDVWQNTKFVKITAENIQIYRFGWMKSQLFLIKEVQKYHLSK